MQGQWLYPSSWTVQVLRIYQVHGVNIKGTSIMGWGLGGWWGVRRRQWHKYLGQWKWYGQKSHHQGGGFNGLSYPQFWVEQERMTKQNHFRYWTEESQRSFLYFTPFQRLYILGNSAIKLNPSFYSTNILSLEFVVVVRMYRIQGWGKMWGEDISEAGCN